MARIATTVDGELAVVDGTVPPQPSPFVEPSIEDLLRELGKRETLRIEIASQRGVISKKLQEATKVRDAVVQQLAARGVKLSDPNAELPFGDDDEDEDGDDE